MAASDMGAGEIGVVICAYTEDRLEQVKAAVASVQRQSVAAREVVVVVDHNPTLYEVLGRELANVTVVESCHGRGLAGARNTGIESTLAPIVAFLDDDAVAEPDWIHHLAAPYADPTVLGVGGSIEPVWPGPRPAWFPHEFDWVVGCTYRGFPTARSEVRNLIGANMSMRREVFAAVGGFAEGIGRVGRVPLGCEETELCIRAGQHWRDRRFVFEPGARVRHHVSPDRVRWAYFVARCRAEGISKAHVARRRGARSGLAAERTHLRRALPAAVARGLTETARGDRMGVTRAAAIVLGVSAAAVGFAQGSWALRASPSTNEKGSASELGLA